MDSITIFSCMRKVPLLFHGQMHNLVWRGFEEKATDMEDEKIMARRQMRKISAGAATKRKKSPSSKASAYLLKRTNKRIKSIYLQNFNKGFNESYNQGFDMYFTEGLKLGKETCHE